jgi:hypothetical protein
MPRLVVNPETPHAWEIQLRPGANTLGRNPANDCQIEHGSVSGSHCRIILENGVATLQDLGSTNGTFVDRAPVQETVLQPGQLLQLGSVQMRFEDDTAPAAPPPRAVATAQAVAAVPSAPPVPPPMSSSVAAPAAPAPRAVSPAAGGLKYCRNHPKSPARWHCSKCSKHFCDLCVGTRQAQGEARHFCRICASECLPYEADLTQALPVERSFKEMIPDAFVYPFRGVGPFFIILFGLMIPGVELVSRFSLLVRICSLMFYGYFYACLQNFVVTSTLGESKPSWPDVTSVGQDVLGPFFRFFCMGALIAGPSLGLVALLAAGQEWAGWLIIPSLVLAGIYFPMALLAVCVYDSLAALNPLLIIPSILKVPLQYLLVLAVLGVTVLVKFGGDILLTLVIKDYIFPDIISSLLGIYFLMVKMRLLGSLYLCNKAKLGWFK